MVDVKSSDSKGPMDLVVIRNENGIVRTCSSRRRAGALCGPEAME